MRARILSVFALVVGLFVVAALPAQAASGYSSFIVGNPADVVRPTTGLVVMQGGGIDVDDNFSAMGAASGGGDFVVIRFGGTDAYNQYIYDLCHCDSVETIVFKNRNAAFNQTVIDHITNAEALFIAGGDQSDYVKTWKDTPIETAINAVAAKPAPIGGTSAGMAILSQFLYSAMSKASETSAGALADPFNVDMTLDRDFVSIPALAGLITDQHLIERDRMGRTVGFLARLVNDGWTTTGKAIASDRNTAVHLDPATGVGTVVSTPGWATPYVYFLRTNGAPQVCQPGVPLTYQNISVYRIQPGGSFNINTWSGTGGITYSLSANAGVLSSSNGSIY
jgi:cyanophycinase-like exopeptidase